MNQVATNNQVIGPWPAAQGVRIALVLVMIIVLAAFYVVGASNLLDRFPDRGFILEALDFPGPWKAYGTLLNWLAVSYVAFAVACALTLAGIASIIRLPPIYRGVALAAVALLSGVLLLELQSAGNRSFDVAWRSICGEEAVTAQREALARAAAAKAKQGTAAPPAVSATTNGAAKKDPGSTAALQAFCGPPTKASGPVTPVKTVKPFDGAFTFIKDALNGAFQTGAVALLTAFLMWCAVDPASNQGKGRNAGVKSLFYGASLLLTLIILTDALFLSFIRDLAGEDLPLVAYQQGLVFYFAVLSSGTLGLAALGGHILSNGGIIERGAGQPGVTGGAGQPIHLQLFGALSSFISSPRVAGLLATFAPIISAIVTTSLGWDTSA